MNTQMVFAFLPEVEREKHIAQFRWTKLLPGQQVTTTHTEVWYEKRSETFSGGGIGWDDDEPDIRHERKVEKHWHIYLLPVLVSEYGNNFSLPNSYEKINGVNEPVKFKE